MKKFGFYALGYKAYYCLIDFIEEFGADRISFVVSARDKNIEDDYYHEIEDLCSKLEIVFSSRESKIERNVFLKFAIGWRWIISDDENLVVFHDSLLPKYRGFSPLVNALINGEKEVGVTALKAASEYDAGEILGQKSMGVSYPKKIICAIKEASELYSSILLEVCLKVIDEEVLPCYQQDETMASYSPWRNDDDYNIDWVRSAEYISRFVDAVGYPYKGAATTINGKKVRVLESQVVNDIDVEDRSAHLGKIIFMKNGLPTVICGDGLLKLKEIVDEQGAPLVGKVPFRSRLGDRYVGCI
jgi:methionyl-tRNA formyltransferase